MNISSMAAFFPMVNYSVYGASKAYVRFFSKILRLELAGSNVHVHCLCPGGVHSEFFKAAGQEISPMARKGMMDASKLATIAVKGMLKKRNETIPGILNKCSFILLKILPEKTSRRILHKIMSKSIKEK